MAYGVFISENMTSIKDGSKLRSAKQATAIENGSIVKLSGLVSGEDNLYTSAAITANTNAPIYLVDGTELIYSEETTKGIDDYTNLADKPFRVRRTEVGDLFSVSEDNVTALANDTVVVGNFLETPATGVKLKEKATALSTDVSFGAKVIARWTFGSRGTTMIRCEVTKVL